MLLFVAYLQALFLCHLRDEMFKIHTCIAKACDKHYLAYSYMFNQPVVKTESLPLSWPVGMITMK